MMRRKLRIADLFCGAGGTSTGLVRAAERADVEVDLVAVNHWEVAVETHAANHPSARHFHASLDAVDPKKVVERSKLDVLIASPECTHHSTARGGRPMSDQSRSSAWHVLSWAAAVCPEVILVENVPEFATWGPLGRNLRPIESRKGETFRAWVAGLTSLGYVVEWRALNAADYGDPTTRRRLFVMARRGRRSPVWPDASHRDPKKGADLFSRDLAPWRTAREAVIDWDLRGTSVLGRTRPLAESTLRRIAEGLRRFGGENVALCEPFLLGQQSGSVPRPVSDPTPTVAGGGAISLVEPFLVRYQGTSGPESVDRPASTLTTRDRLGVVEPFVLAPLGRGRGNAPRSVDDPVPTVLASRGGGHLVEPRDFDVLFRMLQPHELAAAMGFPKDYQFRGNRTETVRQIGNAVPVGVATALCRSAIESVK